MQTATEAAPGKRRMMLRDATSMLIVVAATAVLFSLTLFLFRSYSAHRTALAERWAGRGSQALASNHPDQAITALRAALSYAPGTREYEVLLATALDRAGRADESYAYFLGLWETTPGDGNVNLALARLAAEKQDAGDAINHYRAAIFGTWLGDGVQRRADVRTELARYLIAQHDTEGAKAELLIAAGNTPESYERDMTLGRLLEQAQDRKDAQAYYRKAMLQRAEAPEPMEAVGRLAYDMREYDAAAGVLAHAAVARLREHSPQAAQDDQLAREAGRLAALDPDAELAPRERVARIQAISAVARKRLTGCGEQRPGGDIRQLASRWEQPESSTSTRVLMRDPARQQTVLKLAYDTERRLDRVCGPVTGDDALILRLAGEGSSGPQ